MQNVWVGLALPFCMLGFWFIAAVGLQTFFVLKMTWRLSHRRPEHG